MTIGQILNGRLEMYQKLFSREMSKNVCCFDRIRLNDYKSRIDEIQTIIQMIDHERAFKV